MKTRITGIMTFLTALGLFIYAIWATLIKNHWEAEAFLIIHGSIILSLFAMLYVYWTNFGALDQEINRIQKVNKLIQSQIEFEKIKKDIEHKKLNKLKKELDDN